MYEGDPDEYYALVAACLREAGWDATANEKGDTLTVPVPPDQRAVYEAAEATCKREVGVLPAPVPLEEAEIRETYRHQVAMRQCLIDLGYTVSEPPSEDTFVEAWATGPWSPFTDIVRQTSSQAEWDEANERCPQVP